MDVTYCCHFEFMRVLMTFEMTINTKHDSEEVVDEACGVLAQRLGASFIYKEKKE